MKLNRREFLNKTFSAAMGGMILSNDFLKVNLKSKKPNIVLIMADDLGFEPLRCYGGDFHVESGRQYNTPRLDELANTGIKFNYGFAQPLCTPSRNQIMTGKYNFRNYFSFGCLDKRETTFGHTFKKAGYKTCVAGKWQLFANNEGVYADRAGFDEYCLWALDSRNSRYIDPTYNKNGTVYTSPGEYGPDVFTNFINDFIETNKDENFFAYYPMVLPHGPFQPTPDSPDWPYDWETVSDKDAYFVDMVEYVDKVVGQIADKLDELGIREDTLIIFTGDNGTTPGITTQMQDGTQIAGGKGYTSDSGTHVPLIANWKGTSPEDLETDALVDFSDILPTISEVAGIELPENEIIDGKSFAPLLRGEKFEPREWIFGWCDPMMSQDKWPLRIFARDHEWKLYDRGDLFYIPGDPEEENPIPENTTDPEAIAARERLQKVLNSMDY